MNYENENNRKKRCRITALLLVLLLGLAVMVQADEDFQEALQQTEKQWGAVRQTVQQSKQKFDDFHKKLQEYEDAVFSQNPEKGIELARKLFKLDKSQTDEAKKRLGQLREMFNEMNKSGLKSKLKSASEMLKKADGIMGKVDNVWEFSKKFNPEHGKDNPTYGLRLIGDILTEGAGKLEKIPLIGQILGPWMKAYGEVAGDFANVLDRLGKKIENFRGGALCGQTGYKTDQQKAFNALKSGETCLTFFPYGGFSRLRGEAYAGGTNYFLYDPGTKRGYLATIGIANKIYEWHKLLLEMRALDPAWLASRTKGYKADSESRARKYYQWFSGWKDKSDPGWIIIDKLGLYQEAYFYGRLDEETFVANYVIDDKHHGAIEKIVKEYEQYILVAGTVYERVDDAENPSNGAEVTFQVSGKSYSAKTGDNGQYELLMKGKEGDATNERVSKQDFETITQCGRSPSRVVRGNNYTLTKEVHQTTITGTVYIKAKDSTVAKPADGATVSASATEATELGSATTGADGKYSLTVRAPEGVKVSLSATKGDASGGTSATIASAAISGVDITMSEESSEADTVKWTINVKVQDADGKPVGEATVSGGPGGGVTAGADGNAVVGPLIVKEKPFSVTLTASVVSDDGTRVSGASQTIQYAEEATSNVVLTIAVEKAQEVTVFGRVTDANNVGLDGAVVTGGNLSATTAGGGSFSIGPVLMTKGQSVEVGASFNDGTKIYAASPQTVTFDGTSKNLSVVLVIDVETFTEVTISGTVIDLDGKPLPGATVSGPPGSGTATSDAGGSYTLGAVECKLGASVTVSASLVVDGQTIAGQTAVTPVKAQATAPSIVLDVVQEEILIVTVTGSVVDKLGQGVAGATVSSGSIATATDAGGGYSLAGVECKSGASLVISASATGDDGTIAAGQATITPQTESEAAPEIVLDMEAGDKQSVTISGRVFSAKGANIQSAQVSAGGQSATTNSGGEFTLPAVECKIGEAVSVSASVVAPDGSTASGGASVIPSGAQATVTITIDLESGGKDDLDSLIDSLDRETEGQDPSALLAEFNAVVAELDGIASDFNATVDYFDQRIRELGDSACKAADVSYALNSSKMQVDLYGAILDGLFGSYADLQVAAGDKPGEVDMGSVEGSFDRCVDRETSMAGRLQSSRASYAAHKCDEESAETEEGDKAQDDADPDDVEGGADDGGGVEVCGDGIDNDGDDEIDECDAGCCDKNVQITVTDCGTAADDIFLIAVDGGNIGVTPKGAANTFNVELSPGLHTVKVTCLDDGGEPGVSDDIGTACVSVIVFGTDAGIGGGEIAIGLGGSATVSFDVPEGPATTTVPQNFNGSTLQQLESH